MQNHFETTQQTERENIKRLFTNYYEQRNCSNLILTSTGEDDYNSYDALCISALTCTLIIEYKRRNLILKDRIKGCIIESPKWLKLHDWHKTNSIVLYIIELNDFTAVWNLSNIFNKEAYLNNLDYGFYWKDCTQSCNPATYVHGQKKKWVRDLELKEAEYFLSKDFKKLSLADVNPYLI